MLASGLREVRRGVSLAAADAHPLSGPSLRRHIYTRLVSGLVGMCGMCGE